MILSPRMFDMLQVVLSTEPLENAVPLDVPSDELGDQLIKLYYKVEKQHSRSLIVKIMEEAGGYWLTRLFNSEGSLLHGQTAVMPKMKSLDDFLSLIDESDDYERSIQF